MLPEYMIQDPALEALPKNELRSIQLERLRLLVGYLGERSSFWRRKFEDHGIEPGDIGSLDDTRFLPTCRKVELQEDQAANQPFGSYVCSDRSTWQRWMTTSGTTGRPLHRIFSRRDWRQQIERVRRRPPYGYGDTVLVCSPLDGLMGGILTHDTLDGSGAFVIPAGRISTNERLALIEQLRPAGIVATATYMLRMLEVAEEMGLDLSACGVRGLTCVGEPGAAIEATRMRLERGFKATIIDGYGMTEIFGLGGNCPHSSAIHIADDLVLTEVIDPESGKPLPAGEPGELAFTNLIGDTQPLLRFRSGDIGRVETHERCACGFTGTRVSGIEGRVDDMLNYHGLNIFPTAIETVVRDVPGLSYEFMIHLTDSEPTQMTVAVEAKPGALANADLRTAVEAKLHAATKARIRVEVLPPGSLPRVAGNQKARRVVAGGRLSDALQKAL